MSQGLDLFEDAFVSSSYPSQSKARRARNVRANPEWSRVLASKPAADATTAHWSIIQAPSPSRPPPLSPWPWLSTCANAADEPQERPSCLQFQLGPGVTRYPPAMPRSRRGGRIVGRHAEEWARQASRLLSRPADASSPQRGRPGLPRRTAFLPCRVSIVAGTICLLSGEGYLTFGDVGDHTYMYS